MVVLDVDNPGDGRDGSVTGDELSLAEVEINSTIRRTFLKDLDSSAHVIR